MYHITLPSHPSGVKRRVRVYDWPLPKESSAPCIELPVHSGTVSDIVVTPDDNFLFTCGTDGSVFALGIKVWGFAC